MLTGRSARSLGVCAALVFAILGVLGAPAARGQATITWMGLVSSDWDNPANWLGGAVPGPLDTVRFNGGGPMIAGTRTVAGLNFVTGIVQGGGRLVVTGSASWTTGTIIGGTTLEITPGATMSIASTNPHYVYGTLLNNGTVTWTEGDIYFFAGEIVNNGVFTCQTTGALAARPTSSSTGTFRNNGSLVSASGAVRFNWAGMTMVNNGTTSVLAGSLGLGGSANAAAGTYACLAGTTLNLSFVHSSAPVAVSGAGDVEITSSTFDGALACTGNVRLTSVTINGDSTFTGLASVWDLSLIHI